MMIKHFLLKANQYKVKTLIVFPLLFGFTTSYGQDDDFRKPIAELPWANMESAGFHRDSIENLITLIEDTPPNDFRGIVVIKDNKLVVEAYFSTFWRNHIHDIRSAGKSITALLLGVAIKEGLVQNIEQNVYSFFSKEKYPSLNKDLKKVKIKHLLNMSSGLDADTDDFQTYGHVGKWIAKDEWKEYILSVPAKTSPGKKWVYADIHPLLIAAIIEEKSGLSLKDYAKKKVFDPLAIKEFYWYTNSSNQTGAAGNLYLSTLDFAKLGTLVVNEGKWGDSQIVDPNFIEEITTSKAFKLPEDYAFSDTYGMMWYKANRTFGNKNIDYLYASGNGGNHLIVIPEMEMVIALTSSAYGQRYAHRRSYRILRRIILSMNQPRPKGTGYLWAII